MFPTEFGLILNVLFTLIMFFLAWLDWRSFGSQNHKDFKSVIMSTGVLGTFVGIFVGLLGFDTTKVTDSIPLLLDGLKVAFYTSIVGMGIAIALNIAQKGRKKMSTPKSGTEYLNAQLQKLEMLEHLEELKNVSRMYNFLQESFARHEKARESEQRAENERFTATQHLLQQGFAGIETSLAAALEKLAKGASEGLIEALAGVIRDFNKNLNEQFGQNFVELNNAVGAMVVWQRDYQGTLDKTQESLRQMEQSFAQSVSAIEQVAARNREVMEFYADLKEFLSSSQESAEQLRTHLSGIAALGDDARESLLNVRTLFDESAQKIGNLASSLQQSFKESEDDLVRRIKQFGDNSTATIQHLTQNLITHSEILKNHIASNSDALKESFVMFGDNVKNFSANLNSEIIGIYHNAAQQIHQDSEQFAQTMTQQSNAIQGKLATLASTGEQSLTQLHSKLQTVAEQNSALLEDSLQKSQNMMEQRSQKIEQLLGMHSEQLQNNVARLTGDVMGAIEQMSNEVRTLSSKVREDMTQTLQVMREEMLKMTNLTKEGMTAGANAMVKQNRVFLEGIGNQTKEFFTQSLNDWQKEQKQAIGAISQNFQALVGSLAGNLKTLNDGLNSGISEIKESLRNLLGDVVSDLKHGAEEYNSASLAVLESNIEQISSKIVVLQETSHHSLERIAQEYLTQFKALMSESVNIPKDASMQILSEIENLQKGIAANLIAANQSILNNKEEVRAIIDNVNAHLENQLTETQKISSNLYDSLQALDGSMSKLTEGFKGDYEWFLRRIGEFMGSHRG